MATSTAAPAKGGSAPAQPPAFRKTTQPVITSTGYSQTVTLETQTQPLPNWQIPANNLLRYISLEVTATTSGNSATVAFGGDGNLNVFQTVNFVDASGTSLVGPFSSYQLYSVQKYGGYYFSNDMRSSAVYSATTGSGTTGGSFNEVFIFPCEIVNRTGFGALQNQSSQSPFVLQLTVNASSAIYSTAPTTLPSITVTGRLGGYWVGTQGPTQPSMAGTTQYWNMTNATGLNGSVTQPLPNIGMGNPHRTWIFQNYATGGNRSGADFPNPIQVTFRGVPLYQTSQNLWQDTMSRTYGYSSPTLDSANGLDTGVFVIPFDVDFSNQPGDETGNGYLSTALGDTITLIGTYNASSTTNWLVNFIYPKGAAATPSSGQ
jgi:hypothetical protein